MKATIVAVQAVEVPKMGFLSKTDPYLVLGISSSTAEYRTNIAENTLTPVWNQQFEFNIADINNDLIKVQLKDWDNIDQHKVISHCQISLRSIPIGVTNDLWFSMVPLVDKPTGGRVRLLITITNLNDPYANGPVSSFTTVHPSQVQGHYPGTVKVQYRQVTAYPPTTQPPSFYSYPQQPMSPVYIQPASNPYTDSPLSEQGYSPQYQPYPHPQYQHSPQPELPPQPQYIPPPQPYPQQMAPQAYINGCPVQITVRKAPRPPQPRGPKKVADWFVYPGSR